MTSRVTSYSRAMRSQSSVALIAATGAATKGSAAPPSKVLRSISILPLRLDPNVTQIIRTAPLAARLGAIAGLDPASGRLEKVLRPFGQPLELAGMALHDHQ